MNAVELLTKDHRAVEDLFTEFEASEPDGRRDILVEIIKELSIHAAIEEAKLYPVIEEQVEGGRKLVADSIKEHQRVKDVLGRLDGKVGKAHTKEVADTVARLQGEVIHHVEEEEGEVFPKLEQTLSKTRLSELGTELNKAKATAPTRPHPNQPPANELTGKANAVLDKARDAVSGRD